MKLKTNTLLTYFILAFIMITTYGYSQQHAANAWDIEKDNYYQWNKWNEDQRSMYLAGFITGAWAMGSDIAFHSGHGDLYAFTRDRILKFNVREYKAIINWVYEVPEFQKHPIYSIVIRGEEFLEVMRDYHTKKGTYK